MAEFESECAQIRVLINRGRAYVLYFSHRAKPQQISHIELRQMFALSIRARGDGWTLYARARRRPSTSQNAPLKNSSATTQPTENEF